MGQAGGGHGSRRSAGDPSASPEPVANLAGLATAALCVTLMLAAPALAEPLDEVRLMPASGLDFEAGFRTRPEPTFTQSNIRMLFEAPPAVAGELTAAFAPSEPVFARPEVATLFADPTAALTGQPVEPADVAREPVFMQADVAALFAGGEALALEAPEEPAALPTFMRAEFADLLAVPTAASAGEEPPEPTTALPVFRQPAVTALFHDRAAPLAGTTAEAAVVAPAFLRPDATALFFARFDELAADLPDAPSPKALQTVSLRGPIAALTRCE